MDIKKASNHARVEILDDYKNCSEYRWHQKEVLKSLTIYDGSLDSNVTLNGRGTLSLSSKFSKKKILQVATNTDIEGENPRPSTSLRISLNHLNLSGYNRISIKVYIQATGYQGFYSHFMMGNDDSLTNHAPFIQPNKWETIIYECSHIKRDDCNTFIFTPFLMGCPPEALADIKIYLDNITAQGVEPEHEEGWCIKNNIAYSHNGYLLNEEKIAITNPCPSKFFELINTKTKQVFSLPTSHITSNLGNYLKLDFTNINQKGEYVIKVNNLSTKPFKIDNDVYDSSIWKSLNFLRLLRCGEDINGVHSACHLNCKSTHPDGRVVPNFGGWHDAGDVSQFEICTAEIAHSLFDLASTLQNKTNIYNNKDLSTRLIEEAKIGLYWLLRTRFGDGYRAMAITYSIWRKTVLKPDNNTIYTNKAESGSFENFLASACEALAARVIKDDNILAAWSKRAALEDFDFAVEQYDNKIYTHRWGEPITSQTLGAAILAASELYILTKDEKYITKAYEYAHIVMACQETTNAPINGFFYEDIEHKYILAYEHRGHEQSPIQGLARLYQVKEDHTDRPKIKQALELYSNYVKQSMKYTQPYNLLPGHIYHIDKININHFTKDRRKEDNECLTILQEQIKGGISLKNGWYLRIMPIAISRRGYHATLLSKTKAVSMLANTLNDKELKTISINQLEWVLGKNPFSSSTMYGEGYNYHPLYVAFSRQMVGALPVGIKTNSNHDTPYWPTINNAVYKEIWGHTTAKYIWVLADILK